MARDIWWGWYSTNIEPSWLDIYVLSHHIQHARLLNSQSCSAKTGLQHATSMLENRWIYHWYLEISWVYRSSGYLVWQHPGHHVPVLYQAPCGPSDWAKWIKMGSKSCKWLPEEAKCVNSLHPVWISINLMRNSNLNRCIHILGSISRVHRKVNPGALHPLYLLVIFFMMWGFGGSHGVPQELDGLYHERSSPVYKNEWFRGVPHGLETLRSHHFPRPKKNVGHSAPQLLRRLGSVGGASPAAGPPNVGAGDVRRQLTDSGWEKISRYQHASTYHCCSPWYSILNLQIVWISQGEWHQNKHIIISWEGIMWLGNSS